MEWQQIIDKILMEDNKKIIQPKDLLGTSNFATEKDLQSSVINPNAPTLSGALSYGAYESGNFEKDYGKYGVLNNPISKPNWDDTRAIMQPLGEKIGRGAIKFVGNTAINVVGGLSSLAWGTVDAAINQNAAKIVDNDLSRGLTNLQEQLGDAFPHYYSKAEQEAGFWGKVTTANFLTDQLTNGLSFIAGAIITEGIASAATAATGGALSGLLAMNSVRLAAQTKRMFKGLDTASDIASMTRNAVNVRRNLSTAGTFARQLYTGAGWEGTVEALDFVKRSEQEFLENYRRNNYGEDPSVEELAKFKDHIAGYQNDVLLWNMGLVSFGNFVSLPKTFNYGVKNRSNKYFGLTNPIKSELKDGVRSYRNIYNDWGKTKKALYHTKNLVKRPLAEGVIEEGGQGVIKNAFTDYAISTYDPKNIEATVDWVDSLSGAVKEQLGSTDGQVEMFLGALLGGMGMAHYGVKKDSDGNVIKNPDGTVKRGFGWEGGVPGAYMEGVAAIKENDKLVDRLTSSEETIKRILKPFKLVSNSMDANSNEGSSFVDNNINEAYFSEKRDFYNYAVARIEAGLASEISDDIANQVKSMPIEEFKTTFNYEGDLSTSELESRRQETIESIQRESKRAIKSFGVAKSFAEFYKYPDSIQDDLIMAYGYALYESDLNDKVELDISNKISELVGGVKSAENIVKYNQLNEELAGKQAELKALKKNYETIKNASQLSYGKDALDNIDKAEDVLNQIAEANKAINDINKRMFDTSKSSRYAGDFDTFVSDIQNAINTDEFLREKIAKDPVIADELKSLISDLGKVSNRRQGTIAAFDLIRTPEKLAGFVEDLVGFKEEAIKAILGEDGFNEYKGVTKEATNQMPQTNDSVLSILNEAVEDKPEAVKELVSKIEELKREFSKTKTADGNVYVHNFVLEGFGPSSTRYTSKSAIVGSTFNSTEETEAKFAHNKNTGDAIDLVVKELFVNGTFTKPDNNILSNDQLDQIKEATLALKAQLEEAGYVKFYSDVIFHSNKGNPNYASYAAGETDLIAIRKDGSFIIIDVKAMSKSVNSNKFNTVWQGTDKNNVAINRSNKDQYTIDQSFYSVLANHSVGKSPNGLFLFNIEVTFDDSKTVEEVNPEPLYELPFNQTSTGETVDRFFRDNVIPVNNTTAKRYGLISPDDFINALLISSTNHNTSEVYENSQNVTKEYLIANGQLEIVNFEAEGDAYYPTPEFEEAGLKLGNNKFAVYINVNGRRVGLLKDPRRYLDKAGNVQNLGDPEVLRKFTNPNYVSEEVLQQMVSEFKNQVYLFRKLDALIKDVPAGESKILTREELNNSIDFDLKMRFSSPKAGEDRKSVTESIEPIGVQVGRNQVTGVVIIDKLKNKYSLNEINGSINNRSNVGKLIESTLLSREGVSKIEQVNAFNRYYAIGQTNTGPMLFRLAFKKATEELKDEFLADVKQLAVDPLFKLTQKYLILTSSIKYDSDTAIDMNIGFNKETQKIFIEAIAVSTSPTGESVKTKIPTTGIDASILKDINSYDQLIDLFNAQLASSARFNQVVGTTGAKISNIVLKKENYNVEDFDSNTNIVRYTPIVKVVNNTAKAPAQSVSNANKVTNEEVAPTIKEDSQDVPPIEANLEGAVSLSSMLSNMGVAIDDAALESITKPKEEVLQTNTTTTQSDIEAKKADIERKREEIINIFKTNPILALHIIQKEKQIGSYDDYGKPNGEIQDIVAVLKVPVSRAMELKQDYLEAGKSKNWRLGDEYDYSKYDAELKALEESSKTIENIIQEASDPQPLESAEVNELSELNTKAFELRAKIKQLKLTNDGEKFAQISKVNAELIDIQNRIVKLSNNGNNIGTMQSDEAREEAFEIASLELQRMLNVTPSRMNNLISKFGSNPRLVGAVYRGAVYLADMMPKGTAYHEAFHYVFRTFLTDKEINKIINYAKSKYPKPTAKQLADLKTSQARYSTLNVNQLVDLYYEELLAEAFRSYSNNRKPLNKLNWLQKFWQSILDFIGVFKNKNTDIELLFKNIYDGKFLNAKHKYNVFTSASTLAPMLLDRIHDSGTGELTVSKFDTNESEAISNTILAQTVSMLNSLTEEQRAELSVKGVINMAYMDFIETYNIDNYMDMFESMEEGKADEFYEYMTEYYNSLMLDSNVIAINEDVARKLKMFIGVKDIVEDDNEIPERNYDLSPENISGFSNLNHKTRVYLSTTTYDKTDEFGITRKQAVDGFRLYETLSRALANTTKSKIFFKLQKFAKLNEEAMHFYNRLANDVEYTDGMTHSQLSLSPIYNMTMNAFNNYKVRVTQVLNDYNKNLVFDSNVKGVDFMQVKSWNANFEYKNKKLSPTERANKFNSLVDIFQSYADMEVPEGVNFETAVISEIKSNITNATNILKDNIGMPLSKGYIQYSVLKSNEALLLELKDSSELTDYESEFINDALSILSLYSDIYALAGDEIKSLQLEISRNKNIFKNDDDGAFTRLKRIARANSVFDSTIGTSIYLNAAGKPVTDVIKGNLIIERFEQLKSEKRYKLENFFNKRNQPSIENFRNAFPEFDSKDSEVFFNYLQDNLLINSEHADLIFSEQALIGLLDGTRQTTWEAEGDDFRETNNADEREGSVFADQDSRGKLHTLLTLFAKQKAVKSFKNGVKKDVMFAEFNMGVNETAKTTYTFSAPVKNYAITELDKAIANGVSQEELAKIKPLKGVNSIIEDHYKLLTKEIHRIKRETIALETADSFSEDNPKIRQYHYDNKGKTPTGLDLFHYKQWMQEYDQALYKKVIENPDDYINGVNKAELYKFLIEVAKKQVLDVEQLIKSNDINLLEKSANGKSLIDNYYLDKDRNLDLNSLSQAVWNHYTNVVSFNELLYGDVAYSKKDATDVNKRKKTAAGTKNNFGESYSYAEIFRFDPAEDRILNGKTIAGIDHTDAQSWGSPFWKVHQLIELGNYTSEVKNIYENKIIKGKELTSKEVEILMANGANLNPDKNLYEDGATSLKMSQFTLTRNLTSKLKPGANREALDLLYDELILTYYQYKQDLISREEYVELSTDIYSEIHTYWEPSDLDDGMHAMLNDFELKSLDYRTADSGSKGVFKEGIRRMDNRRMGKQMETDGYKTNIVHGTQLLSIIWSEQELNDIVNFGKNSATLEQVSEHFDELLAERIHNSFIEKRKHLVDSLGKPKFDVLVEAFKSSLSGMKINPFMSEMFDYDTTATGQIKPNYNHNSLPVVKKFEAMFLNFLSDGVLKQKTAGSKLTLVSPYGFKDLKHRLYDPETGYYYSECYVSAYYLNKYGLKPGDNIPKELLEIFGIRIPTQDKHSMMSLRVKGFMPAEYGVAGVFPPEIVYLSGADFDIDALYASNKAFFKNSNGEIVKYGSYINSENPIDSAFEEYINELMSNDKGFKSIYKTFSKETAYEYEEDGYLSKFDIKLANNQLYLAQTIKKVFGKDFSQFKTDFETKYGKQIQKNIDALTKTTGDNNLLTEFKNYKPITNSELNNRLIDYEFRLLHNNSNEEIAATPATVEKLKSIFNFFQDELDYEDNSAIANAFDMSDMVKAYKANADGQANIGPAALFNKAFQNLVKANAVLRESISPIEYYRKDSNELSEVNGFTSFELEFDGEVSRINDLISTIISAMTDNAKEPIAGKLNLNLEVLPSALAMVGMGMSLREAVLIVNQPEVIEIVSKYKIKNSSIILPKEQYLNFEKLYDDKIKSLETELNKIVEKFPELDAIDIYDSNYAPSYEGLISNIKKSKDEIFKGIKLDEINSETAREYFEHIASKIKNIEMFNQFRTIGNELQGLTKLIGLDKGTGATFGSLRDYDLAMRTLGVKYNAVTGKVENTDAIRYFDYANIINESKYLSQLISTMLQNREIAAIFAIQEAKPFRTMVEKVFGSLKEINYNAEEVYDRVNKDLLSFLSMKAMSISEQWYTDYSYNTFTDGENNFANFIQAIKSEPTVIDSEGNEIENPFIDNYFLKFVDVVEVNGVKQIQSNTWTTQSDKFVRDLINGYESIANNKQKVSFKINDKLVEFNGNKFVKMTFTYLSVKDGLQYRSNTILQHLPPAIYKANSRALDTVQELFAGLSNNKMTEEQRNELDLKTRATLGASINELTVEFTKRAMKQAAMQKHINYASQGVAAANITSPLGKEYNSVQNFKDANQNSNWIFQPKYGSGGLDLTVARMNKIAKNIPGVKMYTFSGTSKAGKDYEIVKLGYPVVFKGRGESYFELIEAYNVNDRDNTETVIDIANGLNSAGKLIADKVVYRITRKYSNDTVKPFGIFDYDKQMEILNKLADKKTKKPLTEANATMDSPSPSEEDFSNDAPQGAEVEAMIMSTAVSMDSIFGQMPEGVVEPVIPVKDEQKTINVYWGQAESSTSTKILSNLAPRKFKYKSTDGITREYGSVEHAYQSNKNGQFDKTTYDAYVSKNGYGVKISPKLTEVGRRGNLQLMKDLVVESFVQNPGSEAAKKLLQYDNFTHNTNELIDKAFLEGLQLSRQELLSLKTTKQTTPATLKTLKSLYDAYNKKYGNDKVKGGNLSPSTVEFLTLEGVFRELDNQTRLDGINYMYNEFKKAKPELATEQVLLDIINSLETSLDSIVTSIKGLKESNCI